MRKSKDNQHVGFMQTARVISAMLECWPASMTAKHRFKGSRLVESPLSGDELESLRAECRNLKPEFDRFVEKLISHRGIPDEDKHAAMRSWLPTACLCGLACYYRKS